MSVTFYTTNHFWHHYHFPNPSFFGQYFKRRVGMTPKEFRRKAY